jgi:hypothetical protein
MPNHCANSLKLTATTPEAVALLEQIRANINEEKGFFNLIDPCPEELSETKAGFPRDEKEPENTRKYGYANWYEFQIDRWGTKWDAYEIHIIEDEPQTLVLEFDTAWSPPVGIYRTAEDKGFAIEATYVEQGCDFIGFYRNGHDHTDKLSEVVPAFYDDDEGFSYDQLDHYFTRHQIDHTPPHFGG